MLDRAANPGRHSFADRGVDLYETPVEATRALLAVESLPHQVWEPACGRGAIVGILRSAGHTVLATDLQDHGCPRSTSGVNFLTAALPSDIGAIMTNPPYRHADGFVRHALALRVPKVVMLLRLAFLESAGRSGILDSGRLAQVYPFIERLPMMHRVGWTGRRASSAIAFAWFIWQRDHDGPTTLRRISWRAAQQAGRLL
jgi:hypothetical protein